MNPANSLASALLVFLPAITLAAADENLPDLTVTQPLTRAERAAAVRLARLSSADLQWNDENRIIAVRLKGTDANNQNIALASQLAGLRVLTVMALPQNYLTDDGLAPLASRPKLQVVSLSGAQLTDNALLHLQMTDTLKVLILQGNFTDVALEMISGLPNLEHLDLSQSHITDDGLARLPQLVNLEVLIANDTDITSGGLESLVQLKKLSHLYLGGTAVNDEAVEQLKKLAQLETLFLKRTNISGEGIGRLLPALPPSCRVIHDAGTDLGEREPQTAMARTSASQWQAGR